MLAALDSAELSAIGVSDSVLSKHAKQLEEAGYVAVNEAIARSRQRTWLTLTRNGKRALKAHVAALEKLAAKPRPMAE